jgi:hypothetical protein
MPTSSRNCSTESSLFRAAERGANSARDEGPASDGISAVTASGMEEAAALGQSADMCL